MRDRVFFMSDAHLGIPNAARSAKEHQDALISFLRHVGDTGRELYIVGDLFDFWFEYRSSIPTTGSRVIFELYALVQRGIRVVILPGNHDIWLGSYLSDQVGLDVQSNPITFELDGQRLYVTHGDEFDADLGFSISRAILKSPLCIRLFGLLHPDLGVALGRWTSQLSDERARLIARDDRSVYESAAESLIREGYDIVVCGHYHKAVDMEIHKGRLIVLGNWIRSDTYAVMEKGDIRLMRWMGERGEAVE